MAKKKTKNHKPKKKKPKKTQTKLSVSTQRVIIIKKKSSNHINSNLDLANKARKIYVDLHM